MVQPGRGAMVRRRTGLVYHGETRRIARVGQRVRESTRLGIHMREQEQRRPQDVESAVMTEGRLKVLDGGLTEAEADAQWRAMWAAIADTCEAHIKDVHPAHPRRPELLALVRNARRAASPPKERRPRSA